MFHPIRVTQADVGPLVYMLDQMLTAASLRAGPDADPHGFDRRDRDIIHLALRQLRDNNFEREAKKLRAEQNAERARWEGEIEAMRAEWEKERRAWRVERAELWQLRAKLAQQAQPEADAVPEVPGAAPEVPDHE